MTKYIIKNCPAYTEYKNASYVLVKVCISPHNTAHEVHYCQDCTDCLLKRIVDLCKEPNEPYYNPECEYGIGRTDLAEEILELLEIKECE